MHLNLQITTAKYLCDNQTAEINTHHKTRYPKPPLRWGCGYFIEYRVSFFFVLGCFESAILRHKSVARNTCVCLPTEEQRIVKWHHRRTNDRNREPQIIDDRKSESRLIAPRTNSISWIILCVRGIKHKFLEELV